jgi:hypothetical protein
MNTISHTCRSTAMLGQICCYNNWQRSEKADSTSRPLFPRGVRALGQSPDTDDSFLRKTPIADSQSCAVVYFALPANKMRAT